MRKLTEPRELLSHLSKLTLVLGMVLGVLWGVSWPAVAEQQLHTATTVADTYISESFPDGDPVDNANFGTSTQLEVDSIPRKRALLRFEDFEPTVPEGSTASFGSAFVELTISSANLLDFFAGADLSIHTVTEAWTETGATWNCADDPFANQGFTFPGCETPWGTEGSNGFGGGAYESLAADVRTITGFDTVVQFDVTPEVQAFLDGGVNHGWLVKLVDETTGESFIFPSGEAGSGVPRLVLAYEVVTDTIAPQIRHLEPLDGGFEVRGPRPDLTVEITEAGTGLATDLAILLDGVDVTSTCVESVPEPPPPPPDPGDGDGVVAATEEPAPAASFTSVSALAKTGTFLYTCTPTADLAAGAHTLDVSVSDVAGNLASTNATFELLLGPGPHVRELTAVADATLLAESVTENRGSGITLDVQDTPVHRSLVDFDLFAFQDLVGKTTVSFDDVSLELFAEATANLPGPLTVGAYRLLEDWRESDVVWSCARDLSLEGECPRPWTGGNATTSAEDAVTVDSATAGAVAWTVTNDLSGGLLPAGSPQHAFFGWLLRFDPETGTPDSATPPSVTFTSREGVAQQAPTLTVTFTTPLLGDETPPEVVFTQPPATTTDTSPPVSLTFSDDQSGVDAASFVLRLDETDITESCTVTATGADCTTSVLTEASHVLSATLADLAGNVATVDYTFQVSSDVTPPVLTLVSPAGTVYNDTAPTVEVAYSDDTSVDTSTFTLTLDGVDVTANCTVGAASAVCATSGLAEGTHTVVATVADSVGQSSSETFTFDVVLDTTAPVLTITAPTGTVVDDTTPAVSLTFSDDNAGVDTSTLAVAVDGFDITASCVLGSGTATCEPPALKEGDHTVTAEISDLAGNRATASGTFTLDLSLTDTTPPSLAVTAPAATVTDDPAPVITVSYSDADSDVDLTTLDVALDGFDLVAAGRCSLGATSASCTPPLLGAGTHTVTAAIQDLAGNPATATSGFDLSFTTPEAVAPVVAITEPAETTVFDDLTPQITVTYSDAEVTGSETGVAILTLAVDVDGTDITAGCVVGDASAVCEPPPLTVGTHVVTATAEDLHGNVGTASFGFDIALTTPDTTAPAIAIAEPSTTPVNTDVVPIRVTYSDGETGIDLSSLVITLDTTDITATCDAGATEATCTSPVLAEGSHTLEATVQDLAGNAASDSFVFEVVLGDSTPPEIIITAPGDQVVNESAPEILVEYSDPESGIVPSSLDVLLDGGPITANCTVSLTGASCQSPNLAAGIHTILARIQNGQGNLSEASKSFEVILSQNPPQLSITSPVEGETLFASSFTVSSTFSDIDGDLDTATLSVTLNGLDITDRCTIGAGTADCVTPAVQDGSHTVGAELADSLGNRATTSVGFGVASPETDPSPPSITVTAPPEQVQDDATPAIEVQYSDLETGVDITTLVVKLDGVPLESCAVGDSVATCEPPTLQAGTYTVGAQIQDLKGNQGTATTTFEVLVTTEDFTAPIVSIFQPSSSEVVDDTSPEIIIEYSDSGSGLDLSSVKVFVGAESAPCNVGATSAICESPELVGGTHTILAEAEDLAGNLGQIEATFELVFSISELTPPELAITSPTGSSFIEGSVPDFAATFTDSDSGIDPATLRVELDQSDVTATCQTEASSTTCPSPALTIGSHTWDVQVADAAGNVATAQTVFDVRTDDIAPALVIDAPGFLVEGDTTPEVLLSYADSHSGIDLASLQVLIDGSLLSDCQAQAGSASCEAPVLSPGGHLLQVSLADVAGNVAARNLEFELDLSLQLLIEEPVSGSLTSAGVIDLTGTVSTAATAVTVGDVVGTVGNGVFTVAGVPLREGTNTLTAVARTGEGGIGSATVTMVRDTTVPQVVINSPPDGFVTTSSQVLVTGEYNEPSSSGSEFKEAVVTVNGVPAQVKNRSFFLPDHLLQPGGNRILVEAEDEAGNVGSAEITVTLLTNPTQKIEELLGNAQTGVVGQSLANPLVVRVTDGIGNPLPERLVQFEVSRGDGSVRAGTEEGRSLTVRTDDFGRAQVEFTLGERAGTGNHEVTVTSVGFPGSLVFCASAEPKPAHRIVRIQGNVQTGTLTGVLGEELPKPLFTQVFDAMDNPVAGVPVTYEVVTGGGTFAGQPTFTATTDANGVATATFTLGPLPGVDVHVVKASIENGTGGPAVFNITGLEPGPESQTSVSGIVLDNQDLPVPNVTVSIVDTPLSTLTDAEGRFQIAGAPVGTVHLKADGSTTTLAGTWPVLEFEMVTVSGQDNELGMPVRLLPIDPGVLVGGDADVEIPLEGVPGASLTVFANSVTFADGSTEGLVSFTQVHNDKVPMVPPLGSTFAVALTIQPAGTLFDPPARIQIPNPGHRPGEVVDIFSFDHDLGEFVSAGTASVTPDGQFLRSNPGFGVRKAGWHGCSQPVPETDACGPGDSGACTLCTDQGPVPKCDECSVCTGGGSALIGGDGRILAATTSPCSPMTIDSLEVKIKGDPKDALFGKEQEIEFEADIATNCPSVSYEWDLGDGEMGSGKSATHSYEKAGSYDVKVTAKCDSCSTLEKTSPVKSVEVLDLVEASFKMVETETAMTLEEEDRDGDGNDDIFFRVLGGIRLKLAIPSASPVQGKIQNTDWSASAGHFFDGFEISSSGLTSLGVQGKRELFWEGEWNVDLDNVVTTTVTLNDGHEVVDMNHIVTRQLDDSVSIGDDVKMLQSLFRLTGVAQGHTPGVLGTAVVVDGDFGSGTGRAVKRFQFRSDLFACTSAPRLPCITSAGTGIVDASLLESLSEVWEDYLHAQERFGSSPAVRTNHPQYSNWANSASTELQNTYSTTLHNTVAPGLAYSEIIKAWVREEAIYGHWGRSVNFRLTLGSADELGSIGFSQILHTHKYGTNNISSIANLNLYDPEDNMRGLAVFSNDSTAAGGGGGFHFAFTEADPARDYEATISYTSYPRIGTSYTDAVKDRLSKGIMAYNRGSGLSLYRNTVWPEMLRQFDPPAGGGFGTRTAMDYSLDIQLDAGVPLSCWMWTEQAITTGGDDVCDTTPAGGDVSRPVTPGVDHQTCIVAAAGQPLATTAPSGDDNLLEFSWEFCEASWQAGRSWSSERDASIPAQIVP